MNFCSLLCLALSFLFTFAPVYCRSFMKTIIFLFLFCIPFHLSANENDSLLVVFWNVENFFDYVDDGGGEADKEWSSFGKRRWTKKRFYAKCNAIAKTFLWIGENYGRLPDIIGLAEVENRNVLWKLLNTTLLRKYDYKIIHHDSQDRRGIDVALLYRSSIFKSKSISLKVPEYDSEKMITRDMLHVCLEEEDKGRINVIVNHHPSKFGGAKASERFRSAAMRSLRSLCDSLSDIDAGVPIVAMGDFNDTPDAVQFNIMDSLMVNKADVLHQKGKGTIRYEGEWDLIDMFLVSEDISQKSRMEIVEVPFLMIYDKKYPGFKPLRTYSGPQYIGGVSDHCPIILWIFGSN